MVPHFPALVSGGMPPVPPIILMSAIHYTVHLLLRIFLKTNENSVSLGAVHISRDTLWEGGRGVSDFITQLPRARISKS